MSTTLKDLIINEYNDPKNGFNVNNIYQKLKKVYKAISLKDVRDTIKQTETYQIFKPVFKRTKFAYPLIARYVGNRIGIDLLSMENEIVNQNKGNTFLFVAVDLVSKKAWFIPIKSKTTNECLNAFKTVCDYILSKTNFYPVQVDSDNESAFHSAAFVKYCDERNIFQNFNKTDNNNGVLYIESLNKTIRSYIFKYKSQLNTNKWINAIPSLTEYYNNKLHYSTKMSPNDAFQLKGRTPYYDQKIKKQVATAKQRSFNRASTKLKIGDRVRIQVNRHQFEKRSQHMWSKTIHTIIDIQPGAIYVSDRVKPLSPNEVMKVDENIIVPEEVKYKTNKRASAEFKEHKNERKVQRAVNKEGVDVNRHEETKEEKTDRFLRHRQPDYGAMVQQEEEEPQNYNDLKGMAEQLGFKQYAQQVGIKGRVKIDVYKKFLDSLFQQ